MQEFNEVRNMVSNFNRSNFEQELIRTENDITPLRQLQSHS